MQIIDEYGGHIDTCHTFFWLVENQGYYWSNSSEQSEHEMLLHRNAYNGTCHFVAPLTPSSATEKKKNRLPPAFKQFISLDGSPDSFIHFVNEFGPLVKMCEDSVIKKRESPLFTESFSKEQLDLLSIIDNVYDKNDYYHSYHFYKKNHTQLIIAAELFNLLKTDDYEGLYNFFTGTAISNGKENELMEIGLKYGNPRLQDYNRGDSIKIKSSSDLKTAAVQLIKSNWALHLYPKVPSPQKNETVSLFPSLFTNQVLTPTFIKTLASKWLDLFISRKTIGQSSEIFKCVYSLQYNRIKQSWFPLIKPNSLLAAMWYQLSEEISGNRKYKQCEFCHKWQDVTDNNENWRYHADCAAKKRINHYRSKKKGEHKKNGGNN